jgi:hypothetical protein
MSLRNSECLGFSATIIGAKVFMMAAANNSAEKKTVLYTENVFLPQFTTIGLQQHKRVFNWCGEIVSRKRVFEY